MKKFDFKRQRIIWNMKLIIVYCNILLFSLNSLYSQSDTSSWGKYLFIQTRLSENGSVKYVYEYQDTLGNIIIPQGKYGQLGMPDELGFINAWSKQTGGKIIENNVGFIDINENILIPFNYSRVFSFNHNLACATKYGKTGYINRKGETVIAFLYNSCEKFNDDGLAVLEKGNKKVLIDTLGNEIINEHHSYHAIKENFPYDHVLWIKKNKKWAFFDLKGKPLTPFIFDDMHVANICSYQPNLWYGEDLRWFYKGIAVVEKEGQFAVLNERMEYLVSWGTYSWISPMSIGGLMIVKQNNQYGLLNHKIELIQRIEFDTISNYPAQKHEQNYPTFWAKRNGKYYILDTLGNWKDKLEYDNIELLQSNFYLVNINNEKWRLDRNGTRIIEEFEIIRDDENGFIARKNNKFGLVYDGEIIIPFDYEDIMSEHLGNVFVKKNGKWGVVDEDNNQLLACEYDYIAYAWDDDRVSERNYIVVQNNKFGKLTETGSEIFPCQYDGITTWVEYGPKGHYVMKENRMGLIGYDGEVLIPIEYDKVKYVFGTNWALIYNNGKVGIYSLNSNSFFLPVEYDYIRIDTDWLGIENNKPTQIITYNSGKVNILNSKGKIIRTDVSKKEIENEFEVNIDSYHYTPCSYELLLMVQNRTFKIPDCLKNSLLKYSSTTESIYYRMGTIKAENK